MKLRGLLVELRHGHPQHVRVGPEVGIGALRHHDDERPALRVIAHLQRLGLDFFERELSGRIMTRMTSDLDSLATFLQQGDHLRTVTPGGGGWGDPLERPPELVAADVSEGLVSRERAESVYGVVLACETGLGLAALPDYLARGNPRLTQVLADVEGPTFDTYFVFPVELKESKRVAVFRDFILRQSRDWTLTTVWAYSMDAIAAGLIFMVLSSLYMWWELPQKRLYGVVALGLGSVVCGLFCLGLRWLF